MSNIKQALIKTNKKNFFSHWVTFTQPLHKLNPAEGKVVALILFHYFEYKKEVSNDDLCWKLALDYDTRLKIREELNIIEASFNNVLNFLRKKKVIIDNRISKSYIPNIDFNKDKSFSLNFKFEIND